MAYSRGLDGCYPTFFFCFCFVVGGARWRMGVQKPHLLLVLHKNVYRLVGGAKQCMGLARKNVLKKHFLRFVFIAQITYQLQ